MPSRPSKHSKVSQAPVSPPESSSTVKSEGAEPDNHTERSTAPSVTSTLAQASASSGIPQRHSSAETVRMTAQANPAGAGLAMAGAKVKILVDAISRLRQFGLEHTIPLPELVLVGDQSSGKSSLMGALAEIILPRKQGICTRCPANVKTSAAETWKCDVSLSIRYEYDARSRKGPFPNWKLGAGGQETKPFKTIYRKEDLEEVVIWAQHALLNPNFSHGDFIPGEGRISLAGEASLPANTADYSPNVISIEISGPHLQSLSFYDLPGVFQVAPNEKTQYLTHVFENMTKEYIKHENAQVICAMPMAHDISNSRTLSIILNLKADKRRCMGVLTMPDRLQGGNTHAEFEAVLSGKAQVLPQGYFVTKQPGPDSGIDDRSPDYHHIARVQEQAFFDNQWPREWGRFKERCGTTAISTYLSHQFAAQIAASIPEISLRIATEARRIDIELSQLPAQSGVNVQHVVRECLSRFSSEVRQLLKGLNHPFLSDWNTLAENFRKTLLLMKPRIGFTHESDKSRYEVISLDTDDEGSVSSHISTAKRLADGFETPQGKRVRRVNDSPIPLPGLGGLPRSGLAKQEDNSPFALPSQRSGSNLQPRLNSSHNPLRGTPFAKCFLQNPGKSFSNIGEIRTLICQHRIPGKPDHVDDGIKERFCLQAVEYWREPFEIFMGRTFQMFRKALKETLGASLVGYHETSLYRDSATLLEKKLDEWEKQQASSLEALFELERYKLFTLNEKAFAAYRHEEMQILKKARRDHRALCYVDSISDAKATPEAKVNKAAKVTDDQLGKDPFGIELELAGYVRGYYVTSGLRFSDNVSQNIFGNFFRIIQHEIGFFLETELGLMTDGNSDAICRRLLEEDSFVAEKRQDLLRQKNKLDGFSREFNLLKQQYYTEEPEPEADDVDIDPDVDAYNN